jgi:hypothetical protein
MLRIALRIMWAIVALDAVLIVARSLCTSPENLWIAASVSVALFAGCLILWWRSNEGNSDGLIRRSARMAHLVGGAAGLGLWVSGYLVLAGVALTPVCAALVYLAIAGESAFFGRQVEPDVGRPSRAALWISAHALLLVLVLSGSAWLLLPSVPHKWGSVPWTVAGLILCVVVGALFSLGPYSVKVIRGGRGDEHG